MRAQKSAASARWKLDRKGAAKTENIKITINGKEIIGEKGKTILNLAAENGIEIPNLCYEKGLKPFGACGVCLVEIEGNPKLVRSCSAVAQDGMIIRTDTKRVIRARKTALELMMGDHEGDCVAPCSLGCPAHTNVQGYLKEIAEGNYSKAVGIIKEKIPLPASVGRICPHPCENDCRRRLVEEPLSVAYLKAFAADMDMISEAPFIQKTAKSSGKTVAIIGGGPAGLAAAYRLVEKGHKVTVFDAMPEMGGMLRYGIPEYRLPKAVLKKEINAIENLGVEMKNSVKVGRDIAFDDLRKDYDAVLIAIGAWKNSRLGIPGEELGGVFGGIDFLREVNCGKIPEIGKSVAVIGGGNTAMDACRTAVRCGAEKVYVVYRRTRAEAPAEDIEIEEALEEGVIFNFLTAPYEIIEENGKAKALKVRKMTLGEPDASGRRSPVPTDEFDEIEVDSVITAIGQKCDYSGMESIELTDRGNISMNPMNCTTNMEGVFAAGDATNKGASIAVEAIAEGNTAAKAIDAYLSGMSMDFSEPVYSKRELTEKDFAGREKIPRQKISVKPADSRRKTFDEVINGFSEEQARAEAKRCLECGCHDFGDCKLIRYANENRVNMRNFIGVKHSCFTENKLISIERDMGKCILCGLCVRVCEEKIGKGLLGFNGRGFKTAIKPEFEHSSDIARCAECLECVKICPTGALKIIK